MIYLSNVLNLSFLESGCWQDDVLAVPFIPPSEHTFIISDVPHIYELERVPMTLQASLEPQMLQIVPVFMVAMLILCVCVLCR